MSGVHARHRMHENSLEAHASEVKTGNLGRRASLVLAVYAKSTAPLRDREVMSAMGFMELAKVQPRITELIGLGVLREIDSAICPTTGKRVRRCGLARVCPEPSGLFDLGEQL